MPEEGRAGRDWCHRARDTGASTFSLKKTPDFVRLLRTGRRFRGAVIRACYCGNTLGVIRLGFSVSRKTGGAVERNLFRRRLRQLAKESELGEGFDAVVSPCVKLAEIRWRFLLEDFNRLVSEASR